MDTKVTPPSVPPAAPPDNADDVKKAGKILIGSVAISQAFTFLRENYSFVKEVGGDILTLVRGNQSSNEDINTFTESPSATPETAPEGTSSIFDFKIKWRRVGPRRTLEVAATENAYVICDQCIDTFDSTTGQEVCTYSRSEPRRTNRTNPCVVIYDVTHDTVISSPVSANCTVVSKHPINRVVDILFTKVQPLIEWDKSLKSPSEEKKGSADFWYLSMRDDEPLKLCDPMHSSKVQSVTRSIIRRDLGNHFSP